ncbi:palmitoyltransferase ZDHHC23 isoform X1 [Octopus bimaculoides]|uniref:palmitoyltransferase ZDHHC23 isoform X1 n=1 Tax=Octopus bimaculoides TaxID=37653 RepID=UPI00071D7A5E|nr:palmitoyltransferase ZDHHC23 isoform X1 [Octopus bimaculoides]|eukprot:XP_014771461.1 PREDICTED: palmitoyltransferase ZDHHC23-like isoform X1 [Octopus bimaculoides]
MTDQTILCCCEYINKSGERSHMLACCCDCEDLDKACDNCLCCKEIPSDTMRNITTTISDRCRIPWCCGHGAIQVRLDVIVPVVVVPSCILIGTVGPITTIVTLIFMPIIMLVSYHLWRRHHSNMRTKLFSTWANISILFSYFVFQTFVVGFRKILLWEFLLLFTAFLIMLYCLYQTKKQPGILMKPNLTASKLNENESHNIQVDTSVMIPAGEITWIDSRPIEGLYLVTWCGFCNNRKPPRSGHCYVCSSCVSVRDHHCVWIDNCIGANNHRIFIVCMIFFLFCGLYGSHLTFTTVCTPEMYFNWILFPNDCRFIYSDFQTSISFVTACYVSISTAVMLLAFLQQILLISQNITSQELHQALVRKKTFCGIYAYNNVHNKGFLHNWMEFIFRPSRSISQKIPM